MAPSQLAQLKAALSSAGLNRKSVSKKDRKGKKGRAADVDRSKKVAKLSEIHARFNKFDERETKVKHDVGGRKLKGVTGRPTASKQAGIEQRRKTLLEEHHLRDHRGTFQDRRFGENDPSLSLEDRMLERYTRERQRGQGKKGMFNIEDDDGFGDDDGFALGGLTHGGRSVMDLPGDDFMAQGLGEDDDEEDSGAISRRQVHRTHFGGFGDEDEEDEEPERKKTKQEVMSEIIAKSKTYKLERQHQKEEDDAIRENLDEGLDELRALLGESKPVRPAVQLPGPSRTVAPLPDQVDDGGYDQFVRSLAFEARAQPKDRTKTEEELAVEEKERLEEAEAKRLRRMRGEDSEDEDEGGRKKRKTERKPDADDLDDDFVGDVDEDGGVSLLGPGLTREAIESMAVDGSDDDDGSDDEDEDEEGSGDEDEDDEDDDEDDDDDEVSDLEDLDSEAGDDDDESADDEPMVRSSRKGKGKAKAAATKEIPYTFPCPSTVEEFEDILEGLDDSALPTVVQRIRALHHPSLAQGNKEKLQEFLGVLLDYILILASQDESAFDIISALVPHLAALVKLNPITAASHFTNKLSLMQKNLQRGISRGASNPDSKTFPRAPELVLLRLVGVTWSTSDFSHPVVQPAVLLIGQYVSQSRIRGVEDMAAGLFMCSLIAQYESQSKRLVPEVINFLAAVVLGLVKRLKNAAPVVAYPDLLCCEIQMVNSVAHRQPVDLVAALSSSDEEQTKADLLGAALQLISSFATLYSSSAAFIELFTPLLSVLEGSRVAKLDAAVKSLFEQTTSTLSRQLGFARDARVPLTLQDHKPIPIASYTPKFEDDYAPGKHYDPDAERNAAAKLRAQYKKERKGAIRELRKDNRFLAGERAREQEAKDAEYNAKMRKIVGSLNTERAEEKEMEREKKREKRRRG